MAITMVSHELSCCVFIFVVPFHFSVVRRKTMSSCLATSSMKMIHIFTVYYLILAQLVSSDILLKECDYTRNYTANSAFESNLRQLSSSLLINASSSPTLFSAGALGAIPDTVYVLMLCRGDTANASSCTDCLNNAIRDAQQVCQHSMDATVYYDPCYFRFSYQSFLTSIENAKQHMMPSMDKVNSPVAAFDAAVRVLLAAIVDYAVLNSSRQFGTGVEDFDMTTPKIYGMAQCRPDIAPAKCRTCLEQILSEGREYFSGLQGGRIYGLRCKCNYRFELYPFAGNPVLHLQAPASAVAPSPNGNGPTIQDGGGRRNKPSTILLILGVPLVVVCAAFSFTLVCFCIRSRRRKQRVSMLPYSRNWDNITSISLSMLELSTLEAATENFAEGNKLGEGGFGDVYKGDLPDGQEIAVKRLSPGSAQGMGELKAELVLVAKLQHKNLVRLIGVCLEEHEKLIIYEYMPNVGYFDLG